MSNKACVSNFGWLPCMLVTLAWLASPYSVFAQEYEDLDFSAAGSLLTEPGLTSQPSVEWLSLETVKGEIQDKLKQTHSCQVGEFRLQWPGGTHRIVRTTKFRLFIKGETTTVTERDAQGRNRTTVKRLPDVSCPVGGASLEDLFTNPDELASIEQELQKVQFVSIPRIVRHTSASESPCYQAISVTLVPLRVFDEVLTWSNSIDRNRRSSDAEASAAQLSKTVSLKAKKADLEKVAEDVEWQSLLASESLSCDFNTKSPDNIPVTADGYSDQSFTHTLIRLLAIRGDLKLIEDGAAFWEHVRGRIQELRSSDKTIVEEAKLKIDLARSQK